MIGREHTFTLERIKMMNYGLPSSVIRTESWLMRRTELSIGVKLVYFTLKAHYDHEAQLARVTQQQLAQCLGMTDRHVRGAIVQLRRLGLIQWARTTTGTRGNGYVFLRHPWQALAPHPVGRTALTGEVTSDAAAAQG
jgi:hypothetical protein